MVLYEDMEDGLYGLPGKFDFTHCLQCGLIWLNPQPVAGEVAKFYVDYHTHEMPLQKHEPLKGFKGIIRRLVLGESFGYVHLQMKKWWARPLGRILSILPPIRERAMCGRGDNFIPWVQEGRLLDLGCGDGEYLALMQCFGWSILGVEPDPIAAERARSQYNIPVIVGTLEGAHLQEEIFDAVTINHVIEHVPNPIVTLKECHRVLKKNGVLIVMTPNVNSLGHRIFGRYWRGLEPPRHIYLFSPSTLKWCVEEAGFRVERCRTDGEIAASIYAQSKALQKKKSIPRKPNFSARCFGLFEQLIVLFWKHIGEEISLVARKVE